MFMFLRSWLARGALALALGSFAAPASAQFVIGNGGMSINGFDLSPYGGISSIQVFSSGFGYGGFASGVITPFPYRGWGGGFYDPYCFGPYGYGYGGGYWGGGLYAAPLVIPAETMYGPGPGRRMMGLDPPLSSTRATRRSSSSASPRRCRTTPMRDERRPTWPRRTFGRPRQ
jgi:hypothetical protein